MSFAEVFGPPPAPVQALPTPVTPPKHLPVQKITREAVSSVELQSALAVFSARARTERARVRRGAAMPPEEIDNWQALSLAVDGFLTRQAEKTSSYDVIRARVTVEAELEMDARSYGDIPRELAEGMLDRVARLSLRMSELRRLQIKTRVVMPTFAWPITPVAVTSLFGNRFHPILKVKRMHLGLDLAAEDGQLVTAAAAGTVTVAGWVGGHGKHVEIQHSASVMTGYSHLSQILVEPGTVVKQGDPVGLAGSTGTSTGPHLHFEIWKDGKARDPLEVLGQPGPHVAPLAVR